jgi:hypothetical protein
MEVEQAQMTAMANAAAQEQADKQAKKDELKRKREADAAHADGASCSRSELWWRVHHSKAALEQLLGKLDGQWQAELLDMDAEAQKSDPDVLDKCAKYTAAYGDLQARVETACKGWDQMIKQMPSSKGEVDSLADRLVKESTCGGNFALCVVKCCCIAIVNGAMFCARASYGLTIGRDSTGYVTMPPQGAATEGGSGVAAAPCRPRRPVRGGVSAAQHNRSIRSIRHTTIHYNAPHHHSIFLHRFFYRSHCPSMALCSCVLAEAASATLSLPPVTMAQELKCTKCGEELKCTKCGEKKAMKLPLDPNENALKPDVAKKTPEARVAFFLEEKTERREEDKAAKRDFTDVKAVLEQRQTMRDKQATLDDFETFEDYALRQIGLKR